MVDGDGRSFEGGPGRGDALGELDGPGDALGGTGDALDGPRDALSGPETGEYQYDPTVSTALDRPSTSVPDTVAAPPSAQHFQDLIALRREAEESAAAALSERREATSQASRIIEEAMRAAEMLQLEAQQALDQHRTAAEAEAAAILERARAEAAEIVQGGANDVLEAQRLRREAAAERDRVNAELDRLRRTAQEELFSEANRHAARMDEIRTRVLHGVEAATTGVRDTVWESGPRPGGRFGDSVPGPTAASYLSSTPEPIAAPPSALDASAVDAAAPDRPASAETPAAASPAPESRPAEAPAAATSPEPVPAETPDDDSSSFPWAADDSWFEGSGPQAPVAQPPAHAADVRESFVVDPPVVARPGAPGAPGGPGGSHVVHPPAPQASGPVQPPSDPARGRSEPRRRGWRSRRS